MTTTVSNAVKCLVKTIDGEAICYPDDFAKPAAHRGIIITPAVATIMLEAADGNFRNRRQDAGRMAAYANDMKEGRWRLNGETIIFDRAGVLINGYTRVTAAYVHDATFVTAAQCGVDRDAYNTIDTGRSKSMADMLSIGGEDRAHTIAAALPWVKRFSTRNMGLKVNVTEWPYYQREEFLQQHPDLRNSIKPTQIARQKRLAPPGVIVASHYILAHDYRAGADEFMRLLGDGVGYGARSPIHALRERLLNDDQLTPADRFTLILSTWNKWRAGETCKRVQVPSELPIILGWK
jgi:hypothetical protein